MGLARRTSWKLPHDLTPVEGKRCIQLLIPDDDEYELLLRSAIYDEFCLTWMCWQRDGTRNGQNMVELWRRVLKTWRRCTLPSPDLATFDFSECDMFRKICESDGTCHLEFECCPGEWIRVANLDQVPFPNQAGINNNLPAGGGGTVQYCNSLPANQQLRLPPLVSSGDTITLDSASGGWYDGGSGIWNCPNGQTYLATDCVGFGGPVTGDPVPSADHMTVIIVLNSTPYALTVGTPFSVPGGYSNATVTLQANDSDITNNSGSVNVCVTVKNNAATSWTHTFNFELTAGPFVPSTGVWVGTPGSWSPSQGWVNTDFTALGSNYRGLIIRTTIPSRMLTSAHLVYDRTSGGAATPADDWFELNGSATQMMHITYADSDPSGSNLAIDWSGSNTTTMIEILLLSSQGVTPAGTVTLRSITLTGVGTDPF